jgi:hypothetical protein
VVRQWQASAAAAERESDRNKERLRRQASPALGKDKIAWKMLAADSSRDNFATAVLTRLQTCLGIRSCMTTAGSKLMELMKRDPYNDTWLAKVMNSAIVRMFCCVLIILNAGFIGANTHVALRAEIDEEEISKDWVYIEMAFTTWFTVELLLRLAAERVLFLFGHDRWWNLLDFLLVVSSLATVAFSATTKTLTVARLLRLFRFTRIFRVIRVIRFLQNFRIMIYAILQSFGTLVWVFVVLIFFKFFFAMIFMNGATDYFSRHEVTWRPGDVVDAEDMAPKVQELFGDLPYSLLTLFEAITGGRDWHEVVPPLLAIHPVYVVVFIVYIFFMVFLVLNVVVGGVVKTTSEVYKRDKQLIVEEEQARLRRYCEEIKGFFRQADLDNSGTLSWEEFYDYLHDDKVKAYFQTLELDISQAHVLFMLLDSDESNEVAIDEFVDGCMRLKGQARSIDVNFLLYEVEKTLVKVESFSQSVDDNVERIQEYMRALNPTLAISLTPKSPNAPLSSTKRDAASKGRGVEGASERLPKAMKAVCRGTPTGTRTPTGWT